MIQFTKKSHIAIAAALALVTVGCQSDGGSRWQLKGRPLVFGQQRRQCQSQYARIQPGHSFDQSPPIPSEGNYGIQPGHSTDAQLQYAPEPTYPAPPAPAPMHSAPMPSTDDLPPRHNPDIPGSRGSAPLIEEDVRLRTAPVPPQAGHVKGVAEPDRLSPFSVRSIYEKLRPSTTMPSEVEDGPIASRNMLGGATRVVDYRNSTDSQSTGQPVTLGLPETGDGGSDDHWTADAPSVMQATPSSYRHPMLADPTGLPYGVNN